MFREVAKSVVGSLLDADWPAPSFKMVTCYDPTLRCIPSYPVNRLFVTNTETKFTATNTLADVENGTQVAGTQNVVEIRLHSDDALGGTAGDQVNFDVTLSAAYTFVSRSVMPRVCDHVTNDQFQHNRCNLFLYLVRITFSFSFFTFGCHESRSVAMEI